MSRSSLLPEGAVQLISGTAGDLLDYLGGQDVVAFTGSAYTAAVLQRPPEIAREAVRFTAERDPPTSWMLKVLKRSLVHSVGL